jgi:hypothetical protein
MSIHHPKNCSSGNYNTIKILYLHLQGVKTGLEALEAQSTHLVGVVILIQFEVCSVVL